MVVAFFGHSDFSVNDISKSEFLLVLDKAINNCSVEFWLGGYGNFDDFAATCANEYKLTHKR